MKNQRGFTLMQLMGVLLIIAIIIILVGVISMEYTATERHKRFSEWFEIELPQRHGNLYTEEELAAIRPSVCKTISGHRTAYALANDAYHTLLRAPVPAEPEKAQELLNNVIQLRIRFVSLEGNYENAQEIARYISGLVPEEGCQQ